MTRRQEVPGRPWARRARNPDAALYRRIDGSFVSLLEVHKLLYFLQEAGEGLRCAIARRLRAYAENLTHLLRTVEGHSSRLCRWRRCPDKLRDIVPGTLADAEAKLSEASDTRQRFDMVADWSTVSRRRSARASCDRPLGHALRRRRDGR